MCICSRERFGYPRGSRGGGREVVVWQEVGGGVMYELDMMRSLCSGRGCAVDEWGSSVELYMARGGVMCCHAFSGLRRRW